MSNKALIQYRMKLRVIAKLERLKFIDEIILAFEDAIKDLNLEDQDQYNELIE